MKKRYFFNRRIFLKIFLFFLFIKKNYSQNNRKNKIIFGSCSNQKFIMKHWKKILSKNPEYLILLGDNVYGDFNNKNANELKEAYSMLDKNLDFRLIKKKIPIIPIWDDHDYGKNDGGKKWKYKNISKNIFLKFFQTPVNDIRYKREGIYRSYKITINKKIIKVIGLDTRYFKDDFKKNNNDKINAKYIPDLDNKRTILGEEQWNWLVNETKDIYDVVIILSSFQLLSKSHGWEKWYNFPLEREKILNLLNKINKTKIILSGDRHLGGFYKLNDLYELTSSSLNQRVFNTNEYDEFRLGDTVNENNFGILEFTENNILASLVSSNLEINKVYKFLSIKI